MSPYVFDKGGFWMALLPTSALLGASVLAELLMTGARVSDALMSYPCSQHC